VALVGLEVGVEVLFAVLGIDELVQAVAGVVVLVFVVDVDTVALGQQRVGRDGEAVARPGGGSDRASVDLELADRLAAEVEEGRVRRGEVELDGDGALVGGGAAGEGKIEGVGDVGHGGGARLGLDLGEHIASTGRGRRGGGGGHGGLRTRVRRARDSGLVERRIRARREVGV
jgi:hypothetical protein